MVDTGQGLLMDMDGRFPVKLSTENYYWWNKDDSVDRVGGGRDLIVLMNLKIFSKTIRCDYYLPKLDR